MRVVLAALFCVLAVLASGCGRETVDPAEIAAAAEASASAGTAKVTIEGEGKARGQTFDLDGTGEMDGTRSEFEMGLPGGAGTMRQVADGFVVYTHVPGVEEQLGKEWTRVDMVEAYRKLGIDLALVGQPGSQDPRQILEQLKNSGNEIEKVGTDTVRGVETTHYRGDMEMRSAVERAPAARRAEAERMVEKVIKLSGTEGFPMDVWVDDDKLVRKMRIQMKLNNPAFGGELEMDMTMELFDYGEPVSVDVPSEDEAQDVTDAVTQALAQQLD